MACGAAVERALDFLAALEAHRPPPPDRRGSGNEERPAHKRSLPPSHVPPETRFTRSVCSRVAPLLSRERAIEHERLMVDDWLSAHASWGREPSRPLLVDALLERSAADRREGVLLPSRFVRSCLDQTAVRRLGAPLLPAWSLHAGGVIPLVEWIGLLHPEEQSAWGAALARLHSLGATIADAATVCEGLLTVAAAEAFHFSMAASLDMANNVGDTWRHNGTASTDGARGDASARPRVKAACEAILRSYLECSDDDSACSRPLPSCVPAPGVPVHVLDGNVEGSMRPTGTGLATGVVGLWRAIRLLRAVATATSRCEEREGMAATQWVLEWLVKARACSAFALAGPEGLAGRSNAAGSAARPSSILALAAEDIDCLIKQSKAKEMNQSVARDAGGGDSGSVVGGTCAERGAGHGSRLVPSPSMGPLPIALKELAACLDLAVGHEAVVSLMLRLVLSHGVSAQCLSRQQLAPWLAIARFHACGAVDAAALGEVITKRAAAWDAAVRAAVELQINALSARTEIPNGSAAAPVPEREPRNAAGEAEPAATASMLSDTSWLEFLLLLHLHICGTDAYNTAMTSILHALLVADGGTAAGNAAGDRAVVAGTGTGSCRNCFSSRQACSRLLRALADLVPLLSLSALQLHQRLLRPFACTSARSLNAVNDVLDLLRTRAVDLSSTGSSHGLGAAGGAGVARGRSDGGGAAGVGGDSEDPDDVEAAALLDEMIAHFANHKSLTRAAQQVIFFRKAFWRKHVAPLTLRPREGKDEAGVAAERTRRSLVEYLIGKGMLKTPMLPVAGVGAREPCVPLCERPDGAVAMLPSGWNALLASLPQLVASGDSTSMDATLASLAELMRLDDSRIALGDDDITDLSVVSVGRSASAATRATGGLTQLLQQILEAFSCCVSRAPSLCGSGAARGWLTLFVRKLLWEPQLAWPALHHVLWGWLRLAVANRMGAHQRPLALLLLSLGSEQRRSVAARRQAPVACRACDDHARHVLHVRGRRGCAIETLLINLPIGDPTERAWTINLAMECLAASVEAFDAVDVGKAPPAAWASPQASDDLLVRRDVRSKASPTAGDTQSIVDTLRPPPVAVVWLPPALPQLLLWLCDRSCGQEYEALARSVATLEREAATLARCRLIEPGVAKILQEIDPPTEQQTIRWQLLVGMDDA